MQLEYVIKWIFNFQRAAKPTEIRINLKTHSLSEMEEAICEAALHFRTLPSVQ